jgi:hypothetical protein
MSCWSSNRLTREHSCHNVRPGWIVGLHAKARGRAPQKKDQEGKDRHRDRHHLTPMTARSETPARLAFIPAPTPVPADKGGPRS